MKMLAKPKRSLCIGINALILLCTLYFLSPTKNGYQRNIAIKKTSKDMFHHPLDKDIINDYRSSEPGMKQEVITQITSDYYYSSYIVPQIEYTTLTNCNKLFYGDEQEVESAFQVMQERPKIPLTEETYLDWTKDCEAYKRQRGFVSQPLTAEEASYPLAFSIAMYTDVEQTERLLRMIYQPQNVYCIHIDVKSSLLVHRTVRSISNCFHNVFIASHLDKVKWGDVSVLLPAVNCMKDLVQYYRRKWKYYINLTGQEIPLRTNYELVQIAKIFNGSNDIAGSLQRMQQDMDRVLYKWSHRWSKTFQQSILYRTNIPKEPPPYNLTFYKGELHGFFSRGMVEYIVESEVGQRYLEWCWNTGHPTEHYWNVLNYNRHLKAPGGYQGPQDIADEYSYHPIVRAKNWVGFYDRECQGHVVRGICVYGIKDLPWLFTRPELAANKFHLTYQYLTYDCLEERHRRRTILKHKVHFNASFYQHLPTVLYSRKDGI